MHVETLRKALCFVFGSCAFSFNLLLVYAILTVQCAYIGKYKWLLFLYTLSGIFNGAAQILTMPHMLLNTNGFVFYDSLRLLPPYVSDVVVLVYTSCFFQNLVILTLCFIYRYYAVCEPEKFSQFLKDWMKTISISIGIVGIEMIGLAYVSRRSALSEELMDAEFISVTGFSLTETGYIGNLLFTRTGLNTEMLFLALSYTIISSIQGCIMIKLALRIAKTLRNSLPSSRTVAKHQKKIFTLLLYQLVLPLVFNLCPQQIIIFSGYFHIDTRDIVHMLCCFFTLAQVIDPIITFYLIRPYRIAVLKKLPFSQIYNQRRIISGTVNAVSK